MKSFLKKLHPTIILKQVRPIIIFVISIISLCIVVGVIWLLQKICKEIFDTISNIYECCREFFLLISDEMFSIVLLIIFVIACYLFYKFLDRKTAQWINTHLMINYYKKNKKISLESIWVNECNYIFCNEYHLYEKLCDEKRGCEKYKGAPSTYCDWRNHIKHQYVDQTSNDQKIEFCKYLKMKKRNVEAQKEFCVVFFISIAVSLCTSVVTVFLNVLDKVSQNANIILLCFLIIIGVVLLCIARTAIEKITKSVYEKYCKEIWFYEDILEIIESGKE